MTRTSNFLISRLSPSKSYLRQKTNHQNFCPLKISSHINQSTPICLLASCLCVCVCLSVCLSVYVCVCACVCVCVSVYLSVCLSVCLPAYLTVCLSVYLSIWICFIGVVLTTWLYKYDTQSYVYYCMDTFNRNIS